MTPDRIQTVLCAVFGWSPEDFQPDRINLVDPWWATELGKPGFSPKQALDQIGTLFRDRFGDDIFDRNQS